MHKVKFSSLLLSFLILLIASGGGWLMTAKAGGEVAAHEFIKFSGALAFVIFVGKVVIFKKAKRYYFIKYYLLADLALIWHGF
jgi:hypothetical protein